MILRGGLGGCGVVRWMGLAGDLGVLVGFLWRDMWLKVEDTYIEDNHRRYLYECYK